MPQLLEGKTIVIAGIANKWSLAYGIAESMAREGASLVLSYLNDKQKDSIASITAQLPVKALLPLDVTMDAQIHSFAASVRDLGVPIDAVVHSLAYANREDLGNSFTDTSREGFLLAQNVSAYSLVAMSRALVPLMTQGGSIMTLTYLGATRVVENYNVMGVAKASLEACVRYLATDVGPRGIRVNAISAGPVKTASARAISGFSSILDQVKERAPLRHVTESAEVGDTAVFLASSLSRGVTGNILFVDSGMQLLGI